MTTSASNGSGVINSSLVEGELNVVYSDDDIVVLDKPAGLRTVPGKAMGPDTETKAHVS